MTIRALRRLICEVLIAAVAFTQMAVAAYGCSRLPGTATAVQLHAASVASAAGHVDAAAQHGRLLDSGMNGGHDDAAPMLPGLCAGHCQFGNQSADHPPAPALSPALLTALYALVPLDGASEIDGARAASPTQGSSPAADPPHAILHCCLRD